VSRFDDSLSFTRRPREPVEAADSSGRNAGYVTLLTAREDQQLILGSTASSALNWQLQTRRPRIASAVPAQTSVSFLS
jgi:hypothetical protein